MADDDGADTTEAAGREGAQLGEQRGLRRGGSGLGGLFGFLGGGGNLFGDVGDCLGGGGGRGRHGGCELWWDAERRETEEKKEKKRKKTRKERETRAARLVGEEVVEEWKELYPKIEDQRAECLICTYAGQAHALLHYIKRSVWRTVYPFTALSNPV